MVDLSDEFVSDYPANCAFHDSRRSEVACQFGGNFSRRVLGSECMIVEVF